jgi:uncharacterized protein
MSETKAQQKQTVLNCHTCGGQCCRYFALQIDKPRSGEDFDHLRWYLAHGKVALFIEEKEWYLQVNTKCNFLSEEGKCGMYHNRPKICRDYGLDESGETECHGTDNANDHEHFFANIEALETYLVEKGKRWASIPKEEFAALRRKN